MKKVWITYSWIDNQDDDVFFIKQEIESKGYQVRLDRYEIVAGKRLWEQIDRFITSPQESDAWILYATQNSLTSEPCREEYAYALDRALSQRGSTFPIIGVFPSSVNDTLIPTGIRSRLYANLQDPYWLETVCNGIEGNPLNDTKSLSQ